MKASNSSWVIGRPGRAADTGGSAWGRMTRRPSDSSSSMMKLPVRSPRTVRWRAGSLMLSPVWHVMAGRRRSDARAPGCWCAQLVEARAECWGSAGPRVAYPCSPGRDDRRRCATMRVAALERVVDDTDDRAAQVLAGDVRVTHAAQRRLALAVLAGRHDPSDPHVRPEGKRASSSRRRSSTHGDLAGRDGRELVGEQ